MVHLLMIAAHTISGLVALTLGIMLLRPPTGGVTSAFRVYLGALWLLVVFLIAAVVTGWSGFDRPMKLTFAGLSLLACYMAWRGWQAFLQLRHQGAGWQERYISDVGFTLISLFDGFVIVGALSLGAPTWVIALVGVAGVVAGVAGIKGTRNRVLAEQATIPGR